MKIQNINTVGSVMIVLINAKVAKMKRLVLVVPTTQEKTHPYVTVKMGIIMYLNKVLANLAKLLVRLALTLLPVIVVKIINI